MHHISIVSLRISTRRVARWSCSCGVERKTWTSREDATRESEDHVANADAKFEIPDGAQVFATWNKSKSVWHGKLIIPPRPGVGTAGVGQQIFAFSHEDPALLISGLVAEAAEEHDRQA